MGKRNFWGWEWRVLEGKEELEVGLLKLGSCRREREDTKEPVNWREAKDGEAGASLQKEKFGLWEKIVVGPQERKTTCFNCLSFYCQTSYSSSWKRIQGEDGLCFPVNSIPTAVPHLPYACSLPTEGQRGWGWLGQLLGGQAVSLCLLRPARSSSPL